MYSKREVKTSFALSSGVFLYELQEILDFVAVFTEGSSNPDVNYPHPVSFVVSEFDTVEKSKATCERLQVWLQEACLATGHHFRLAQLMLVTEQH